MASVEAIQTSFKKYFMRRRPEWNLLAPCKLPLWFRLRLKRIDHRLVLQYIPPNTMHKDGLPAAAWPSGAWYICGRLKRSRAWISKRAIFVLTSSDRQSAKPTYNLVRMLKMARNERKQGGVDTLEDIFERSLADAAREKEQSSKDKLMDRVIGSMRKMNMCSGAQPRVVVPQMAG